MKKKFKLAWYYWVLIIIVFGGLLMAVFGKKDNKVKVSAEKAEKRDITEIVSANGKVQPEIEVKIAPEVSGEIVDLMVNEGDSVKKGQLLVRINPDLLQSDETRNRANLNNARANYENSKARLAQQEAKMKTEIEPAYKRNKKLHDDHVISDAEFETSQSVYQAAQREIDAARATVEASRYSVQASEALLNQASKNLLRTEIFATMDGIISKLNVKKGERVVGTSTMAGTELLRIADMSQMEMQVDVSENDIIRVRLYDTAIVEVDAYPGKKFKGVVKEVANSATTSATSGTDQVTNFVVKVRILRDSYGDLMKDISAKLSPFRPGMSGTADIQTDIQHNVLSVPIEAVTTRSKTKKDSDEGEKDKTAAKGDVDGDEDGEGAEAKNTDKDKKDTDNKDDKKEVVFKLENGKTVMVEVKTGIQDNKYIQILEGVKPGDKIISGPYSAVSKTLKNGDEVKEVPKSDLFSRSKN
jgi:HlyD family secretion protein